MRKRNNTGWLDRSAEGYRRGMDNPTHLATTLRAGPDWIVGKTLPAFGSNIAGPTLILVQWHV
jgi:hypothetical protein